MFCLFYSCNVSVKRALTIMCSGSVNLHSDHCASSIVDFEFSPREASKRFAKKSKVLKRLQSSTTLSGYSSRRKSLKITTLKTNRMLLRSLILQRHATLLKNSSQGRMSESLTTKPSASVTTIWVLSSTRTVNMIRQSKTTLKLLRRLGKVSSKSWRT